MVQFISLTEHLCSYGIVEGGGYAGEKRGEWGNGEEVGKKKMREGRKGVFLYPPFSDISNKSWSIHTFELVNSKSRSISSRLIESHPSSIVRKCWLTSFHHERLPVGNIFHLILFFLKTNLGSKITDSSEFELSLKPASSHDTLSPPSLSTTQYNHEATISTVTVIQDLDLDRMDEWGSEEEISKTSPETRNSSDSEQSKSSKYDSSQKSSETQSKVKTKATPTKMKTSNTNSNSQIDQDEPGSRLRKRQNRNNKFRITKTKKNPGNLKGKEKKKERRDKKKAKRKVSK